MSYKFSIRARAVLGAGAAALLLTGAAAVAQPRVQTAKASFARAAERVEAQGFTILEMDRDQKGFDVEALASDGRRMELDVAADGAILRQRLDR
jgi:DNA-binding transcriptional MocR family regulator